MAIKRSKTPKKAAKKAAKKTTNKPSSKEPRAGKPSRSVLEQWSGDMGGVRGAVNMSDEVVATIAGLTAQSVPGIHSLGKSTLIPFGASKPTRGVEVEVGRREVALDLEVVIEHGCNIRETTNELRERIVADVDQMTGRKVVELNLDIVGIELPRPPEEEVEVEEKPRRVV